MNARMQDRGQSKLSVASRMGRLRQRRLQAAGLERLIAVLKQATAQDGDISGAVPNIDPENPRGLARLQAAHTAYGLASSPMQREAVNGWFCSRAAK